MKDNWDSLRTVLYVVRLGSVGAAAKALGVNMTTVTRRITAAEEALGTLLFERRASGYVPTDAGRLAAEKAQAMEAEEAALRRAIAGQDMRLEGPLSITAPQLLIATPLAQMLAQFLDTHPGIDLTVRATNELLDLENHEVDVAIRISNDPGDTLVGRRLTRQDTASFATPELAQRYADDPAAQIDWIGFTFWTGPPQASLQAYPNARVRLRFDDMVAVLGAAQAGLGVVRLPMFLGRATPGLIQVPMLPPQPYQDIWALSHPDLKNAAKVIAFKSALAAFFDQHRQDFIG